MLDSAFLFSYAIAMFASGFIAERVSIRYFLSIGMIMTGIFTYMFGLARTSHIHSLSYFVIVQIFAGIFQTTGWPGVVTLVGRWFGKKKRGLIFGIWNSHTSIGNILGTLIAAHYVETDWALSFVIPGIIIGGVGFLLFLFLVDQPEIVGCGWHNPRRISNESDAEDDEEQARRSEAVSICILCQCHINSLNNPASMVNQPTHNPLPYVCAVLCQLQICDTPNRKCM